MADFRVLVVVVVVVVLPVRKYMHIIYMHEMYTGSCGIIHQAGLIARHVLTIFLCLLHLSDLYRTH